MAIEWLLSGYWDSAEGCVPTCFFQSSCILVIVNESDYVSICLFELFYMCVSGSLYPYICAFPMLCMGISVYLKICVTVYWSICESMYSKICIFVFDHLYI